MTGDSPWKRLLKISCSQTFSPFPSPHVPPPPPLALWKRPAARAGKPAAAAAEPTNSGRRGGRNLRPEGAAAVSPTPGALQGRGRGRRRGARWEMQSSPSERLNLGRGSLPLASEDSPPPPPPGSHRAYGPRGGNCPLIFRKTEALDLHARTQVRD
ncbi:unnamed protein product [Rangifer tarandus platyrhynchus]|uniref:Uncharacterized protein n=1 Tax=Rangifer tarandus platyrhynchus TaxID=3082113 RepID=A0ABN8XW14_RANTA|nr:unnamed protein product [Rangifer tarandus platyrhynchus]